MAVENRQIQGDGQKRADERQEQERGLAPPAVRQAGESQADKEAAQPGSAEQETRCGAWLVHDFRDVEGSKNILQKKPGNKPAGTHAAEPDIANSQNG